METNTDRIERTLYLNAPIARIWRALSDPTEFGSWFGVVFQSQTFVAGQPVRGKITHKGYEHLTFEMTVVAMEAERRFAYRWHPYAVDPAVDYSSEPTTLVEFFLEPTGDGTLLKLIESGFDQIPAGRRAEAFRMNGGGWTQQMIHIEKHVTQK